MNENIINSLEQYVKDINPQYAILLLSGAWGCGKTYFVEKWIDQYKTSNISKSKKQESEINLRPVKVSLFGLLTNKELYI
jgi:predicted AAA+ superfamily ATPase